MAINHPDWNAVRSVAAGGGGETLYRRVAETITETNEETNEETTREVVRYSAVAPNQSAKASFARIEEDVARLVQELQSYQLSDRELRNALEADNSPGAEVQRRG